ncbi:SDR family NAD(P)-dependent oxidoreductase [Sphingobium sp. JS3065]|uniref:SDR family NAD(P)-dependent oxidoreductase n=1 Tax=Sphingobium sp. JS3065 TaxID=2970925 RepID=UPI0022653326|nr:SDR family NAD(P)-dependent oxidoreductase [Sphingobium sp. JS3065]UZW57421.1 SDR family NAD(P)-dependent oxidoreductase [Sphingobium sp. JS3065]
MRYDGKVAVITGAGRGLGREQALLLAERGAKLVVNDLGIAIDGSAPSSGPAQEVVDLIRQRGGEAVANFSDVSQDVGVRQLIADAVEAFGGVDIVVGNAGRTMHGAEPDSLTPELFEQYLSLMLSGLGLLVSAAWPYLAKSGEGRIILTSSSGGIFGLRSNPYYGAAKGGVIGLLRCLALDGEPVGIKVNALCPLGSTRLFAGFSTDENFNNWFNDRAKPEYVAPLVAYLAHRDCEATGRAFLAGLGHISEIFTGLTPGLNMPGHNMEDIRDNFAQITDREGYAQPTSALGATGFMISDAPV